MKNSADSPGLLFSEILPPCVSMIVLQMISPNNITVIILIWHLILKKYNDTA